MKQLFAAFLLLLGCLPACATTWYATSSSANINATSLWVPTSTGSCTGSGTALVWGAQANGDVFDANGCTALAVNVDPGAATGASAGVCGTVTVTVTLQTNSTNGGGFTYATASNLVIHSNVTATKTTALAITGSTGGGTICGDITGGSAGSQEGISDSHTLVTEYLIGNLTGGSVGGAFAYYALATGTLYITGNVTGGGAYGINIQGNQTIIMTGNCIGSNTTALAFGCDTPYATSFTLTGNIINSSKANGQVGLIYYTPSATNYACYAKDSSYAIGTEDCTHTGGGAGLSSHAVELPLAPAITNVKSGVNYGSLTGTLAAGSVSASSSW